MRTFSAECFPAPSLAKTELRFTRSIQMTFSTCGENSSCLYLMEKKSFSVSMCKRIPETEQADRGSGGLMVRSLSRRAPGLKPVSPEDPPCSWRCYLVNGKSDVDQT
ncbi:hypothetical protein AVEN_191708-1 [Araneus ventricosus]|uniref:Uncharacterized protein n=1 Tax=Araneus ventricosus TaxID=182803 RepID=A0A4Y2LUC8_ARAVE|nr:hypothetical protein AVEN_191708-1 [Araneus ventricosus]